LKYSNLYRLYNFQFTSSISCILGRYVDDLLPYIFSFYFSIGSLIFNFKLKSDAVKTSIRNAGLHKYHCCKQWSIGVLLAVMGYANIIAVNTGVLLAMLGFTNIIAVSSGVLLAMLGYTNIITVSSGVLLAMLGYKNIIAVSVEYC